MSAEESSSMSRFFRSFKSKSKNGLKGRTIKKSAPKAQDGDDRSIHNELASESKDMDNDFPHEYYTPRPVPKSFSVGEVRKMSNNGSPPDCLRIGAKEAEPGATTSISTATAIKLPNSQCGQSSCPQPPSPKPISSDLKISSPEQARMPTKKLLPNGTNGEQRLQSTFHLLLGQQDPSCLYFTRRYFNLPDLDHANSALESPNNTLHRICELDPQAFEIYKIYMHIGKISFRCSENVKAEYTWIACWPLINAHILGCVIEEPGFADRVMDALAENLAPGVCPDVETVKHLFDGKNGIPTLLQQFVVDRFVDTQQQSRILLDTPNLPISFRLLLLEAAMKRLSKGSIVESKMGCHYHTHSTDEACYKTQVTLQVISKEKKLAEARELSARDAEVVEANAMHNGVKSVDWEKRRLDANQSLRAASGRTWVGFRRLESGKIVDRADALKQNENRIDGREVNKHELSPMQESYERTTSFMNGTRSTFDLTKAPNNPRLRQSAIDKKTPVGEPHLHVQTNHLFLNGKHDTSTKKSKSVDTLEPAELQGSTMYDIPHPLSILPGYKRGIIRVPNLRDQNLQMSVVANNTHDIGTRRPTTRQSLQGEFAYENAVNVREHTITCPGAYPESIVGV